MIHDPAIFYDEVSGNYYTYSTGAICQKSKDLVHWQEIGKVVERLPQESVEWTGSEDIWAPDIVKVGKEYRLYCSNSSWGVRQSCIFLAVADCPEGPFEPKGCVLKTTEKFPQSVTNALWLFLGWLPCIKTEQDYRFCRRRRNRGMHCTTPEVAELQYGRPVYGIQCAE